MAKSEDLHIELGRLAASIRLAKDDEDALGRLSLFLKVNPVGKRIVAIFDLLNGCGNHGCRVKEPEGVATNGPCRCAHRLADLEKYEDTAPLPSAPPSIPPG